MRGTAKFFMLSVLFCLNWSAYADENSLQKVLETSWSEDYRSLMCSDNLIRMRKRLNENQIKNAYVLHISHKHAPHFPVLPLHARNQSLYAPRPIRWGFHAVLLLHSVILDLDYTDSPTVVSFEDYFQKMWSTDELENHYVFQIKSLALYSKYDADGRMENSRPFYSFRELKDCLSTSTCER